MPESKALDKMQQVAADYEWMAAKNHDRDVSEMDERRPNPARRRRPENDVTAGTDPAAQGSWDA
jgi:hypothetical protein